MTAPKQKKWDYALHIKGASLDSLNMLRISQYMKEFADLMGKSSNPMFGGIVKGSVVLRAKDRNEHPALTRSRLRESHVINSKAHRFFERLQTLMAQDGVRGEIVDGNKNLITKITPIPKPILEPEEITITDSAELDGVLVGIAGIDNTAHVQLLSDNNITYRISVEDMDLARELATCFRLGEIRIHVRGTWRRSETGAWVPLNLHASSFEKLDDCQPLKLLTQLASIPGNKWSELSLEDAEHEWKSIRGLDDSSH